MWTRGRTILSDEQQQFWQKRHSSVEGIRAVGCISISDEENEAQYAEATDHLSSMLARRLKTPETAALLDLGFGQGHYARMARQLGIGTYVGLDFASPLLEMDGDYSFRRADICEQGLGLGQQFDVVLLIDVAFHVVDDDAFLRLLENARRHAKDSVIVTGLFEEREIAAHVLHRPLDAFSRLGRVESMHPWRDTSLAVFRLPWWTRLYRKTLSRLRGRPD